MIPVSKAQQNQLAFSWQSHQYTVLPWGYVSSPALCHNLAPRDLDHFSLPQGITLGHYIDDFMLTGLSNQGVATTLDLLGRHLHVTGWEINPKRPLGFYLSDISRGQVVWGISRYPFQCEG